MPRIRGLARFAAIAMAVTAVEFGRDRASRADTVVLNNGIVYRGFVDDKEKPLVWVDDGLKRVVLRDSKIKMPIVSDASFRNLEVFRLEQPLVVHGGAMPKEVVSVRVGPWNDRGRRPFAFEGSRLGKIMKMEQAINEMGPHLVRIRGVDGFWLGVLSTNQVPRDIVLAILGKVDQTDKNERIRVARFLIQAEWYAEARTELDRILKDFPDDADLRDRVAAARASVIQLEAVQAKAAIERCRTARQPHEAAALVKAFPSQDISADLIEQVRAIHRNDDAQADADKALADDLRALSERVPSEIQDRWKKPLLEALKSLKDAPDAVRDRFVAWQKAKAEGGTTDDVMFALAMSGFVVGADAAVTELETASTLWSMRDQVEVYLQSPQADARIDALKNLEDAKLAADADRVAVKKLDVVTRLAVRMLPPLHDDEVVATAEKPKIHRVRDDSNDEPTEYSVCLPPEYNPLRSYPTVVALHDGNGMPGAIAWWGAEAARRGYIVIAPEYKLAGQEKVYLYSTSEHAAVELALRDARRRYAIDSDRVFLGGQLVGANMAWDFGLAHPDLFAGVVAISGLPLKYAKRYLANIDRDRVSLYVALGDLAPAATEVVYTEFLKPLIAKAYDVTYVEYHRRGLEDLPEEAPAIFDWMERRRRDPYPKKFDVVTARQSDNRFYGVVIGEFKAGRTMAPEAVDPLFGSNLNPATIDMSSSALSNLIVLKTGGIQRMDVWVSPKLIDFNKKLEVRINGTPRKGLAKPNLEPLLEDLRVRGDRRSGCHSSSTSRGYRFLMLGARDGMAGAEALDFGSVEPELFENLFVVFADFRGALGRHFGHAMHLNGAADRRF